MYMVFLKYLKNIIQLNMDENDKYDKYDNAKWKQLRSSDKYVYKLLMNRTKIENERARQILFSDS